jgi:hypothetical protein
MDWQGITGLWVIVWLIVFGLSFQKSFVLAPPTKDRLGTTVGSARMRFYAWLYALAAACVPILPIYIAVKGGWATGKELEGVTPEAKAAGKVLHTEWLSTP